MLMVWKIGIVCSKKREKVAPLLDFPSLAKRGGGRF
jgi:hypothetical protein